MEKLELINEIKEDMWFWHKLEPTVQDILDFININNIEHFDTFERDSFAELLYKTKNMENLKTSKGEQVVCGKFYVLKYKWGESYKYGYGWINPEKKHGNNVDIICDDGGVTYQNIENVIFLNQIKQ